MTDTITTNAESAPRKFSLKGLFAPKDQKPKGRNSEKVDNPPPEIEKPITPKEADDLQEGFNKSEQHYKDFSRRNDTDIMNTLYNAMLMSAANPYYKNNFGKNDLNGRMNNKTYNATLNMQRLVDRYNNRARLRQDPGAVNEYGANSGLGTIEYNKPIETVDTRQYAQDLELSQAQRGKDLNRADTVASAIPNKFAKSKEMEVMVNEFLTQNEASINKYMRTLMADTEYKEPTMNMLREKFQKFLEDYKYFINGKIYNAGVDLSNNSVFMNMWLEVMKSAQGPDQSLMLTGDWEKQLLSGINQAGVDPLIAPYIVAMTQQYMTLNSIPTQQATATAAAKQAVTSPTGANSKYKVGKR